MQSQMPNILSIMTFLPLVGALIVMFLPRPIDLPEDHGHPDAHGSDGHDDHEPHGEPSAPDVPEPFDMNRTVVNGISLFFTSLTFLVSLLLFGAFESGYGTKAMHGIGGNMQFIEKANWIQLAPGRYVQYHMGVDGISLLLILLTTFLMVLTILYSFRTKARLKEFMVFLLLLESAMIGVFCALDLVLFYIFFEAMLIPMYFLIGIFGHDDRIRAAIKFFIYTFAGSVLMLIAIVAVYSFTGTFDILALTDQGNPAAAALHGVNPQALVWMFAAFALAFMIKVPMFPFHTWLPAAHVEAPTAGSVILAGVMLKMGTYGFVRICIPMFREQAINAAPIFIVLSIIGIIYASLVAAVQPDAKKLVAYSSIAHLGFVVLGLFTFTRVGTMGALVQNINHGISTPMLFFIVGMMYERKHTREISQYGGLKKIVPMMATMLLIATLASIAVPFFNGFVGEFPVLLGSWVSETTNTLAGPWPTVLAATGMIWSAVYMLWWYQRLMLGPITHPVNRRLPDLSRTEWAVLLPLVGIIFWFGLGSNYWTQRMDTSVDLLLPLRGAHLEDEQLNTDFPVTESLNLERSRELGLRPQRRPVRPLRSAPEGLRPAPVPGNVPPPRSEPGAPGAERGGQPPAGKQPGAGAAEPANPAGATTPVPGSPGSPPGGAPPTDTGPMPPTGPGSRPPQQPVEGGGPGSPTNATPPGTGPTHTQPATGSGQPPATGQPTTARPAPGSPAPGASSAAPGSSAPEGKSAGEKSAGEKPSGEKPSGEKPSGGKP